MNLINHSLLKRNYSKGYNFTGMGLHRNTDRTEYLKETSPHQMVVVRN